MASDAEVLELALIENLQRKDLTAFEESEALQQLAHRCHYTHEDMARKLGKSRTSITEALALNNMPDEVRNLCRLADITSRSTLLQIVRQATPQKMLALVERMAAQGAVTRQDARAKRRRAGRHGRGRLCLRSGRRPRLPASNELHEEQGRQVRDHRGAREHHPRAEIRQIKEIESGQEEGWREPFRGAGRPEAAWRRAIFSAISVTSHNIRYVN